MKQLQSTLDSVKFHNFWDSGVLARVKCHSSGDDTTCASDVKRASSAAAMHCTSCRFRMFQLQLARDKRSLKVANFELLLGMTGQQQIHVQRVSSTGAMHGMSRWSWFNLLYSAA